MFGKKPANKQVSSDIKQQSNIAADSAEHSDSGVVNNIADDPNYPYSAVGESQATTPSGNEYEQKKNAILHSKIYMGQQSANKHPAATAPEVNNSAEYTDNTGSNYMGENSPTHTASVPVETGQQPQQEPEWQTNAALVAQEEQALAAINANQQRMMEAAKRKVASYSDRNLETPEFLQAKKRLSEALIDKIDHQKMEGLSAEEKRATITEVIIQLIDSLKIPLTSNQHQLLTKQLLDEVLGFGPLEVLLADPEVSDIMVNGYNQVYIEKAGKIALSDVQFHSEAHLLNIIQKVVQRVGRRVDETSPMVDARMPDGSRFNAIIPPLALDGSLVSIRKFKEYKMPLSQYVEFGSATQQMVRFLEICAAIRLNIIISGGTGSGKTTLLNALSGHIDEGERVITIEDAAELKLHQPHVLRLETRPPNTEGVGEITQRALVKNALRMRPDRIILGEIRSDEVIDVLQAMNTGHDGSMATIHANNPRECLTRLENLFGLSGLSLPLATLRSQIAGAIQLIVQVSRMRDGVRRITQIEEIVGMEGDTITTQTLFSYKVAGMGEDGRLQGQFVCHQIRPRFTEQASYYGLEQEMLKTLGMGS